MKTIFKIHPFFYLFACICIFTGYFKNFVMITFIILFHELGHIITSLFFKWKIDRVVILPFGGLTLFNEKINRPIIEEFLIAIMGPIFQIIGYLILNRIINNNYFYEYNIIILLFNLIPIYPLDGSKIINCFFNIFFNFRISFYMTIYLSFLIIFIFMIFIVFNYFNFFFFVIIFFLGYKVILEYLNYPNIYNKFLFERYLYNFNFSKVKYIDNINKMYKGKRHLIRENKFWKTEKEILRKRFDFQRNIC